MSTRRPTLEDYRTVVPAGTVDFLRRLSERVRGRRVLNVSVSREVGGVAEILDGLVPLLEEVGVESAWETLDGDGSAAPLAARLHHALQGGEERLPEEVLEQFLAFTRARAAALELAADMVLTHDALASAAAGVDLPPPVRRQVRGGGLLAARLRPAAPDSAVHDLPGDRSTQ